MPEPYDWLFVERVPLLFDRRNISRQLKVETWLDLTQLLGEIRNFETEKKSQEHAMNYVV